MLRRLALLACVLLGLAGAPAASAGAASTVKHLTCARYGYSLTIGGDWKVARPCTANTTIQTPLGLALAIVVANGAGWKFETARTDLHTFVASLTGYAPAGSPRFSTPSINGRRWSLGVVGLKDAAGGGVLLSVLETANHGLVYAVIALATVQPDAGANSRLAQVVSGVFSSITLGVAQAEATGTPSPSPSPGAGAPAAGLPLELVGTWQGESLSGITYVDNLGNYAPPSGSIVQLTLSSNGAFIWDGLLQEALPACAHQVFVYETGTAILDQHDLTVRPRVNTVTSRDTCGGGPDSKQQRPLVTQVYRWTLDLLQRGSKLCLLQLHIPKAQPACYWLQGSPSARLLAADVTWSRRYADPNGARVGLNTVSCPNVSVCVAAGYDGILTSADGGATWTRRITSAQITSFAPSGVSCPSASLCVLAGDGVLISNDGGVTWAPVTGLAGNTVLNSVSCPSVGLCVAVGAAGAILTGTATGWTPVTSGAVNEFDYLRSVSCTGAGLCVAVGDGGLIVTSADGGATWIRRSATSEVGPNLRGVSCPGAGLCVAVGGGLQTSTDGGASWTPHVPGLDNILDGNPLSSVSCPGAAACVAVGESGTILSSADGGLTWTGRLALGGEPLAALASVSCAGASACVAVGSAGAGGSIILQSSRAGPRT